MRARLEVKDVLIGTAYEVSIQHRTCPVRITGRVSGGIWLGVNVRTERPVYVGLRDLIRVVPAANRDWAKAAAGDIT